MLRTNKSRIALPFLELLCRAGWFESVELKFLLPGHSHDLGDAMHGKVARKFWSKDHFGRQAILQDLDDLRIDHLQFSQVSDIDGWLTGGDNPAATKSSSDAEEWRNDDCEPVTAHLQHVPTIAPIMTPCKRPTPEHLSTIRSVW
eukprot:gene4307-14719_t